MPPGKTRLARAATRDAGPTLVESQSPEALEHDGGVAARVQKRRRVGSHTPVSPAKRVKRSPPEEAVEKVDNEDVSTAQQSSPPFEGDAAGDTNTQDSLIVEGGQENPLEQEPEAKSQEEPPSTDATMQVAEEAIDELERQGDSQIDGFSNSSALPASITPMHPPFEPDPTLQPPTTEEGEPSESSMWSGSQILFRPREWLRSSSLPLLEHLSDQILDTVAASTTIQLLDLYDRPAQESSIAWREWIDLFKKTKKFYSHDEHLQDSGADIVPQKANLAFAVLSLLNPQSGDFLRLHKHFSELFLMANEPLAHWQTTLWYQIKIRLFGYGTRFQEDLRVQLVNELFPADFDAVVRRRRGLGPHVQLTDPETRFVSLSRVMRNQLLPPGSQVPHGQEQIWQECIKNVGPHLREHVRRMVEEYRNRKRWDAQGYQHLAGVSHEATQQQYNDENIDQDEIVRRAALAAHAALSGTGFSDHYDPQQGDAGSLASPFATSSAEQYRFDHSASTQEQYEKARHAAAAKAASKARAVTLTPSQRRPWSTEEENALMTGLDRVQGPHWSQILELYGPNGSISEVLKDRNQVQLKDKARNLKLFFLKSGHEVPHYLKYVTGELKTRAPAQATRSDGYDHGTPRPSEDEGMVNHADDFNQIGAGHSTNETGDVTLEGSSLGNDAVATVETDEGHENAGLSSANATDMAKSIQQALDGMRESEAEAQAPQRRLRSGVAA